MINEIIEKIKSGKVFTVACSAYEEYYWYKDNKFYTLMENGYSDPIRKERDEDWVRKQISRALNDPTTYDAGFDFEGEE